MTTPESPYELSLGVFDDMGIDGLSDLGKKDEPLINLQPSDLTERLLSWCERELGQTLESEKREKLLEGMSIFMAVWGRARKEEGMRSVGASREKAQELFDTIQGLQEALDKSRETFTQVYNSTGSSKVKETDG